jgi:hypothetical protein
MTFSVISGLLVGLLPVVFFLLGAGILASRAAKYVNDADEPWFRQWALYSISIAIAMIVILILSSCWTKPHTVAVSIGYILSVITISMLLLLFQPIILKF